MHSYQPRVLRVLRELYDDHAVLDVVARPGLGTQNHAELTVGHALERGARLGSLMVSGMPEAPNPVEQANERHLRRLVAEVGLRWGPSVPLREGA